MKTLKEQSKDLDSEMSHRLAVACLRFVDLVEAMLTKLKRLLQWSNERVLLARISLPLFIENLLKPRKKSQKDEHEEHWGIGGK